MATDLNQWVPLKQVVSYALDECEKSYSDFDRAWIIGLRALVDMNFDVAGEPKTVRIELNGNKTATIPSDNIGWSKVGLLDNNGCISTLKINNGLTTWMDTSPNRITKLADSEINNSIGLLSNGVPYINYYYEGNYCNLFGIGGGLIQYGECKVDEKNGVIIFPPDFQYNSIMFEYLSSPERNEDYKVELRFQEAVISFIKWKFKLGTAAEYYAMVIAGRRRGGKKKVTLQGIAQVLREGNGMALRT